MTRYQFPNGGQRLGFKAPDRAGSALTSVRGVTGYVYLDPACTVLAGIRRLDNTVIAGSVIAADAGSLLPVFLGPDNVTRLYFRYGGLTTTYTLDADTFQVTNLQSAALATETAARVDETTARIAADTAEATTRAAAITAETAARVAGDLENSAEWVSDLTAEIANRQAADDALSATVGTSSDGLTAEVAARTAAVSAEATIRANAITAEASARSSADSTEATARTTAVTNEATARAAADTAEVTARQAAISAESSARGTAIAAEATARSSADSAEVTARTAAVSAEVTARQAADAALGHTVRVAVMPKALPYTTNLTTLKIRGAMDAAYRAGFVTEDQLLTVVAIAVAESSLNPIARNWHAEYGFRPDTDEITQVGTADRWSGGVIGSGGQMMADRGLWQISSHWWPGYPDSVCDDPYRAAAGPLWNISTQGTDFGPWDTFAGSAAQSHYDAAVGGWPALRPLIQQFLSRGGNVNIASPGAALDGTTMVALDKVMLGGQTNRAENGLYLWNSATTPMTRIAAPLVPGTIVTVTEGGAWADTRWTLTTNGPIVLGTTPLNFSLATNPAPAGETVNFTAVPNGSSGNPAIAFQTETGTGIYRPDTGQWGLAVLGAQVLQASAGRVDVLGILGATAIGIGRTTPDGKLHAQGSNAALSVVVLQSATAQTADILQLRDAGGTPLGRITAGAGLILPTVQASGKNALSPRTFVGRKTSTGAPTTGTWAVDDEVVDSAGATWRCTVAGTPGTWTAASPTADLRSIGDGLTGAPATAWATEQTTGTYRPGVGQWGLAVLGTQVLQAAAGRVDVLGILGATSIGVGRTTPDGRIHAQGSNAALSVLVVQAATAQTADILSIRDSAGASIGRITSSGGLATPTVSATGKNSLSTRTFVGRSGTTGAPTTGAWLLGDEVLDYAGDAWRCTLAGTPGNWVQASPPPAPKPYITVAPSNYFGPVLKADFTCDGVADEVQINQAITLAASYNSGLDKEGKVAGRPGVRLLPGQFVNAAPIRMKTGVSVTSGASTDVMIDVAVGFAGLGVFVLDDIQVELCRLSGLTIDGQNVGTVNGIHYDSLNFDSSLMANSDSNLTCDHILIQNMGGKGVYNYKNRCLNLHEVRVTNCASHGFHLAGPDGHGSNLQSGGCFGHGFYIDATNWKFSNSKAWYSAQCGWFIDKSRGVFSSCESQDNTQHGYWVTSTLNCLVACQADSNSYNKSPAGAITGLGYNGFHITAAGVTNLVGCMAHDKNENARGLRQGYGINITNPAAKGIFGVTTATNLTGSYLVAGVPREGLFLRITDAAAGVSINQDGIPVVGGGGSAADPTDASSLFVMDDFMAGGFGTGLIGSLGWTRLNGAGVGLSGVANHPGAIGLSTNAVAATVTSLYLAGGANNLPTRGDQTWDETWWVRLNEVDAVNTVRIGMTSDATSQTPINGVYLEKLAADTNWFYVTRAGSTQTRTDSGIAATAFWIKVRIRSIPATPGMGFTIGGSIETLQTTNVPTGGLVPIVQIYSDTTATKIIEVDRFQMTVAATR